LPQLLQATVPQWLLLWLLRLDCPPTQRTILQWLLVIPLLQQQGLQLHIRTKVATVPQCRPTRQQKVQHLLLKMSMRIQPLTYPKMHLP
jgi:hypothetical protein